VLGVALSESIMGRIAVCVPEDAKGLAICLSRNESARPGFGMVALGCVVL
jgi:hypothetical protein